MPSDRGDWIRVYNCGRWVVSTTRQHPACHLFAVDEVGKEYLLDVSFGEGAKGGNDTLLYLAARDIEHRRGAGNRDVHAFGEALQFLKRVFG